VPGLGAHIAVHADDHDPGDPPAVTGTDVGLRRHGLGGLLLRLRAAVV